MQFTIHTYAPDEGSQYQGDDNFYAVNADNEQQAIDKLRPHLRDNEHIRNVSAITYDNDIAFLGYIRYDG